MPVLVIVGISFVIGFIQDHFSCSYFSVYFLGYHMIGRDIVSKLHTDRPILKLNLTYREGIISMNPSQAG